MFKKSRRIIVMAIMLVLVFLWIGTLGVIYISSYVEMTKQNQDMLAAHADMYSLEKPTEKRPSEKPKPTKKPSSKPDVDTESPKYRLTTFYTVAVSYDGEILDIQNEAPDVHTDAELKTLAQSIIDDNKMNGTINNLAFYKTDKGSYTLVAFMDNTVINESAVTLYRYTLIFGGSVLVLFFFLSLFFARKIVNPLEDSYQKQKQFISDAGHELKTPISVISANAELLSREIGENKWLQNIQYENERMGLLVTQLLELARTENVTPSMGRVDFSRLVAGEALPFESVAFEKGHILSSNIESDIDVDGNSTQLKQLVSILLDNAIRHSKEDGEVHLTLRKERNTIILSVINKGDEIPADQREKIFERFYRVDIARNSEDKHYGLGLAIAKAIVNTHRGHIDVRCYNGVVEFRATLPVSREK